MSPLGEQRSPRGQGSVGSTAALSTPMLLNMLRSELTHPSSPCPDNISFPDARARIAQAEWRRIFDRSLRDSADPSTPTVSLTADNLQSNVPWGDPISEKPANTCRFYGANVNGFTIDREGGQFSDFCRMHQEVQADISSVQEHNLDCTQSYVRSVLYNTAKRHWHRSRITHSCTTIPFATPYKPGGTMLLSSESITARMVDMGSDPLGRWSYQTFQGRQNIKVTFISAYQVVDAPRSHQGSTTAAAQQYRMLADNDDSTRNPRTAFRRDLLLLIKSLQNKRHDVLLSGDFNEPFGTDSEGMLHIALECQLIDVFASHHPHLPFPATYARGRHRLDYVLATPRVSDAVIHSGYEPFGQRFHTDHRSYYIDFDEHQLFGSPTQQLASYPRRGLHANNLRQVTEYLKEKHRLFERKNIYHRILRLDAPGDRHAYAERLDRDIVAASLAAERRTTRFAQPMWSKKLLDARQRVSALKRILAMYRTRWDLTSQIATVIAQMQSSFLYPSSERECSKRLRDAQREVRDIIKAHYQTRDAERDARIATLEASGCKKQGSKARILRNLRKAEEIKRMFQRIRGQRQSDGPRGITRLEVPLNDTDDPKTCTEWRTIDIPSDIMQHLQRRNRKHSGKLKAHL